MNIKLKNKALWRPSLLLHKKSRHWFSSTSPPASLGKPNALTQLFLFANPQWGVLILLLALHSSAPEPHDHPRGLICSANDRSVCWVKAFCHVVKCSGYMLRHIIPTEGMQSTLGHPPDKETVEQLVAKLFDKHSCPLVVKLWQIQLLHVTG